MFQVSHALVFVGLLIPSRLYELLPITVLIGTIFVFARLAQGSEYTILRTSGLGLWRALRLMLGLGLAFVPVTFLTPRLHCACMGKAAQLYKARFDGRPPAGPTGAWLREKQGESRVLRQRQCADGRLPMKLIRIFEFDSQGHLLSRTQAPAGHITSEGTWVLQQATRSTFAAPEPRAGTSTHPGSARLIYLVKRVDGRNGFSRSAQT